MDDNLSAADAKTLLLTDVQQHKVLQQQLCKETSVFRMRYVSYTA